MKQARLDAGLSQEDLARKLGISVFTISRLERGAVKNVSLQKLRRVAETVGASVSSLLGEKP